MFIDELLSGLVTEPNTPQGVTLERVADAPFEPVTVEDFKLHKRLDTSVTAADDDYAKKLRAARLRIEAVIERSLIQTTWRQAYDNVERKQDLFIRPLLSVVSINTIPGWEDDTQVTFASSGYGVSSRSIIARTTWPAHRGHQSFIVTYKSGYYALPDVVDDAVKAAARAAVPETLKLAILGLAAAYTESLEGQGAPVEFAEELKRTGGLPSGVADLIQAYIPWGV